VTRRTVRRHSVALGLAGLLLVPAVFFGYFALDASIPAGQRAVYAVLAAVPLVLAVRAARIGVYTGPEGVTVRGILRSWRLRWDEIERFEWGRWRGFGDYPVGVVRGRDGSRVTVLALNPPFEFVKGTDRRVPRLLEELNELLGRARGVPAPDSGAPPDPRG
jgi:Bacterial PH domain